MIKCIEYYSIHMRGENKELHDLQTIEAHGRTHTLYEVTIPDTSKVWDYYSKTDTDKENTDKEKWIPIGPATYYEIYRQDGKYIGRGSKAIRCERV